jgi:hypothetical protein
LFGAEDQVRHDVAESLRHGHIVVSVLVDVKGIPDLKNCDAREEKI